MPPITCTHRTWERYCREYPARHQELSQDIISLRQATCTLREVFKARLAERVNLGACPSGCRILDDEIKKMFHELADMADERWAREKMLKKLTKKMIKLAILVPPEKGVPLVGA